MASADFDQAVLRRQQVLLERESRLRLFQQLHQEPEYPTEWRRADLPRKLEISTSPVF